MKAVIGYLFAGLGIVGLAVNSTLGREMVGFLDGVSNISVLLVSVVLLVLGLIVMVKFGGRGGARIRQVGEEVPIYEGTGKKRRIVGYRVD